MGQMQVGSQVSGEAGDTETPSKSKENGREMMGGSPRGDNDPRSPSGRFHRTPLRFFPKYGSISNRGVANGGVAPSTENLAPIRSDPRSPNKEIIRTPILSGSPRGAGRGAGFRDRGGQKAQKLFDETDKVSAPPPEPLATKN